MAVGRDVMGADGLTNAERYAKRLADKKLDRRHLTPRDRLPLKPRGKHKLKS